MTGRVRGNADHRADSLGAGWEFASSRPGALTSVAELTMAGLDWLPTTVPSTVAASLHGAGRWSLEAPSRRFDGDDWWYRLRFAAAPAEPGVERWLCLDGLATVADVWLNGHRLLQSRGMFTAHECRVDEWLRPENELLLHFHSLDELLKAKRPRPRWRAPMVEHQQLRWFRTTLLGRTPGWSPPAAAVGPWREIRLEHRRGAILSHVRLQADGDGLLTASCRGHIVGGGTLSGVSVEIEREGRILRAPLAPSDAHGGFSGRLVVPDVVRWWPHTHGEPALYDARLILTHADGEDRVSAGAVGFRSVTVRRDDGGFGLEVNGTPVFCRGACWTPIDPVSLREDPAALDRTFDRVVESGMNMLRVGGTMVYESDGFLDRADRRGVLLWQDLMFANMDYPEDDPAFLDEVRTEVSQQCARLAGRPSVAVICGNSEMEQQAAMFGASRDRWSPPLFHSLLASLVHDECAGVPYWPSSAHGGDFPHQSNAGTSSYYGVGAYLRPLEDARRAEVRFATECLAFANVPNDAAIARMPGGLATKVHHPTWKARTPRDLGAGWDFDDVRDHYLAQVFRMDPLTLRYADHDRYLELSRVVTGEVMAQTFAEWRRTRSATRGGLIWFLRDLWAGAGWGVLDETGAPKAAWHFLRRALAPVALSISDEGVNGLRLHLANDRATNLNGTLRVSLFRAGEIPVGSASARVDTPGHSTQELSIDAMLEGFRDLSHAYRFGAPAQDLVVATLEDADATVLARTMFLLGGPPAGRELDVGLQATVSRDAQDRWVLEVGTRRFAYALRFDIAGFEADDEYFSLAPGETRRIRLRALGATDAAPRGKVHAVNADVAAKVTGA